MIWFGRSFSARFSPILAEIYFSTGKLKNVFEWSILCLSLLRRIELIVVVQCSWERYQIAISLISWWWILELLLGRASLQKHLYCYGFLYLLQRSFKRLGLLLWLLIGWCLWSRSFWCLRIVLSLDRSMYKLARLDRILDRISAFVWCRPNATQDLVHCHLLILVGLIRRDGLLTLWSECDNHYVCMV